MKTSTQITPDEIRTLREAAKLSQAEAAATVGATRRTWQNWESPVGSANHRKMPTPTACEFRAKAEKAVAAFARLTSTPSIVASAIKVYPTLRAAMRDFAATPEEQRAAEAFFNQG